MRTLTPEHKARLQAGRRAAKVAPHIAPVIKPIQDQLSALPPARRTAVAKRAALMPESMRAGYLRAATGNGSPRQAIRVHCYECMGYDRQEVLGCTALACPLYAYRPGATK